MGRRQSEPPRDLLEKVMAVADAMAVLPAETRPYLNKWGIYCHWIREVENREKKGRFDHCEYVWQDGEQHIHRE